MDCSSEKCDVIDNCRCYADENTSNIRGIQTCGVLRHGVIVPCNAGCCPGGCPGQCKGVHNREPYGIGRTDVSSIVRIWKWYLIVAIVLLMLSTGYLMK